MDNEGEAVSAPRKRRSGLEASEDSALSFAETPADPPCAARGASRLRRESAEQSFLLHTLIASLLEPKLAEEAQETGREFR